MMELSANKFMYVNTDTLKVTDENDEQALEFVHFYLKGQSFLFNQIRKMIGCMIQTLRGELNSNFIANTHRNNSMHIALAPGDGLLLEKVAYDKYNSLPMTKEPIYISLVSSLKEVDTFREGIVSYIA